MLISIPELIKSRTETCLMVKSGVHVLNASGNKGEKTPFVTYVELWSMIIKNLVTLILQKGYMILVYRYETTTQSFKIYET